MNYVFDTSALVAHVLGEAGADQVQALMEDETQNLFISALSLFELAGVLKQQGAEKAVRNCWEVYREVAKVVPVDADLSEAAWTLREATGLRIPMADAIIAATAQACESTLVHRDQHLASIPESLIPQMRLAER